MCGRWRWLPSGERRVDSGPWSGRPVPYGTGTCLGQQAGSTTAASVRMHKLQVLSWQRRWTLVTSLALAVGCWLTSACVPDGPFIKRSDTRASHSPRTCTAVTMVLRLTQSPAYFSFKFRSRAKAGCAQRSVVKTACRGCWPAGR